MTRPARKRTGLVGAKIRKKNETAKEIGEESDNYGQNRPFRPMHNRKIMR